MARPDDIGFNASLHCIPDLTPEQRLELQQAAAAEVGMPVQFHDRLRDGSRGLAMVVIPAGLFYMGSPVTEFGHRPEEAPQQLISLGRPVAISRHPVTAEQFDRFREATGWRPRPELIWPSGDFPVVNVRIRDAQWYARWLSEQTGACYRLPTEAEWEYAARAGSSGPFHFGESVTLREVLFNPSFPYEEVRQKRRWRLPGLASLGGTEPVGGKAANLWGLYDVHGNVWEFTASAWSDSHAGVFRDATASTLGQSRHIVLRGGSYFDPAVLARSAARRPRLRDQLDVHIGFRLIREL